MARKPSKTAAFDNSLTGVMYPCEGGLSAQIELPGGAKASGQFVSATQELSFKLKGQPVALATGVVLPEVENVPRSFVLRYVDTASGAVNTAQLVLFAAVDSKGRPMVQIRRQKVKAAGAEFDFLRAP